MVTVKAIYKDGVFQPIGPVQGIAPGQEVCLDVRNSEREDLRDRAVDVLRRLRPQLVRDFGLKRLVLFGSFARSEADRHSDVDVAVELEAPIDFRRLLELEGAFSVHLGRPADVSFLADLQPEIKARLESEGIEI